MSLSLCIPIPSHCYDDNLLVEDCQVVVVDEDVLDEFGMSGTQLNGLLEKIRQKMYTMLR